LFPKHAGPAHREQWSLSGKKVFSLRGLNKTRINKPTGVNKLPTVTAVSAVVRFLTTRAGRPEKIRLEQREASGDYDAKKLLGARDRYQLARMKKSMAKRKREGTKGMDIQKTLATGWKAIVILGALITFFIFRTVGGDIGCFGWLICCVPGTILAMFPGAVLSMVTGAARKREEKAKNRIS